MPVNNKMNEYEAKKTDPNKFNEINLDNEANQYRLNDKVLDAQQTKFFVSINRLVTSSKCNIIYLLCFICCLFISVLSLIDIFVKLFLMYQVWILVLGIVFLAIFLIDAVFKFMVMV